MRREEFNEQKTGDLIEIEDGIAFVPHPLPVEVPIDRELLVALGNARGALGEFVGEARLIGDPSLVIDPLAMREAVLSNRIEGTHTAIADVLLQRAGRSPRDNEQRGKQEEVIRYFDALELGSVKLRDGWPLGLPLIRSLHDILMTGEAGATAASGAFRRGQVYIGQEERTLARALKEARFVPPPPDRVPATMENLAIAMQGKPSIDPLIDCAILHYQFETIHPFEDGNGRLGRLLIPMYLMAKGLTDQPYLYLSSYFEPRKSRYVDLMKAVSTRGEWLPWIGFFLDAITSVAGNSRRRVRRARELQTKYRQLVQTKLKSQAALSAMDYILQRVVIRVAALAKHNHCQPNTAKKALQDLQRIGILEKVPDMYPATWVAAELIEEVYKDDDVSD
jgi:Fic family protein